jgi:hypothetical protein
VAARNREGWRKAIKEAVAQKWTKVLAEEEEEEEEEI